MISVIIPSYNRRDCVLALLSDVFAQQDVDIEVIVVDDCSPDDSAEAIRDRFPQVILLENAKNGGPAVSRNRGIRHAKGEIIVGLDSDVTLPDKYLLSKVQQRFVEEPSVCGLAFRLLMPNGVAEDVLRWWHPVPVEEYADKRFLTSYFSGTAYAFRKASVVDAGMYPEVLYMHYEEVELAYRILDAGGSILHCPDLVALHHANEVSRRSEVSVFYKPRNQVLLAVSCLPGFRAVHYLVPRLCYQFAKACSGGHLKDFFRAMQSAKDLLPDLISSRKPLRRETLARIGKLKHGLAP
ncbi:glycosyltransferase family 2 protein [Luteolibacter marinus]|uniref:glycosyltransferase family 2 protein n=1 Tax=Luteolibacter marinus TaxID=2776705 RepID=UPI0018679E36|nr:glycosyltransferase family 2 protein [Luteolibacter marinus]